jgi:hypothetical protein
MNVVLFPDVIGKSPPPAGSAKPPPQPANDVIATAIGFSPMRVQFR